MKRHCIGGSALASVLVACAVDSTRDEFSGSGVASIGTFDDGAGTGDPDDPADTKGPPGDDAAKFDVGGDPAADGGGEGGTAPGCTKIDFLFVVDNSWSMANEQEYLVAAFPGFIAAIEDALPEGSDPHIMVVDTDAQTQCNPETCADPQGGNWEQQCLGNGGYACVTNFDDCDGTMGAGVLHPAGMEASNMPCAVVGGKRWLDASDPDIGGSFACMAKVGVAGDNSERPMDALRASVSPELVAPGACNDGFLRDDAILVVTFISDDACYEDAPAPEQWVDDVVTAKGGDPNAVVVLGILPGDGCHDSPEALAKCDTGGIAGEHWREFVAAFPLGSTANVCDGSYAEFFAAAVGLVVESCEGFEPPG
jgi:hypothetical protein